MDTNTCESCGKIFTDTNLLYKCAKCDAWICLKCGDFEKGIPRCPKCDYNFGFGEKSGCFIATSVYDSYSAPEVMVLREFRDKVLRASYFGRVFINIYYLISPPIADFISQSETLKRWVREMLIEPIVKWLKRY